MLNDKKIIDNIRTLGIDMINAAGSGHSGIVLGAAPIIYTIFKNHLRFDENDPKFINRDRFILSSGHGAPLLYSTMFFAGMGLTLDDLKNFRKIDSITPGHPNYGLTPFIEFTTGLLGQGIASSVGIALSQEILSEKFNIKPIKEKGKFKKEKIIQKGINLIDYYTYVLCGDGDLMEGVTLEALSLAGNLKLGKLIILYDSNDVTLDSNLDITNNENVKNKFEALGFHVSEVLNGEDINKIDKEINNAKSILDKPSLIIVKTTIGKYTDYENSNKAHGIVLNKEEITKIKSKLDIRDIPYMVSTTNIFDFRKFIQERNLEYLKTYKETKEEFENLANKNVLYDLNVYTKNIPIELDFNIIYEKLLDYKNKETREINNLIMNEIANIDNYFLGGSADLSSSTKTNLKDKGILTRDDKTGKNIFYGVREHAVASISNGLAVTGFNPFASTFLAFSDYMKPAIRMSAMMNLPVTYIFTHDSLSVGEDGKTHQPVDQIPMLRAIPNFNVYRPSCFEEIIGTWKDIYEKKKPSAIILSRSDKIHIKGASYLTIDKGAYIIKSEISKLDAIIIATGSEVSVAVKIADELYEKFKKDIRVVSMPCIENFISEDNVYKNKILPKKVNTFFIEASSSLGLHRFVNKEENVISINSFGYSGSKEEVLKKVDFDYESIKTTILNNLK
ncbi:MAG: transketolase family protein [Bacilli bacterium]